MARSKIYVGLEIGTSKVCVVVGEVRKDSGIKILGVGQAPSRGVRKGEIIDFEAAQASLQEAILKAEDGSEVIIKEVFMAISGGHISSLNHRGRIQIPESPGEITEEDLEEVKEVSRDVEIPAAHAFIHTLPRHYVVDGQEKVTNPLGMVGQELEAEYHIIHGIRNRIQNTIRCVREVPLEVEDIVFSPLAAAQVIVGRAQKNQGALVIDMGGGTTDYVLYQEGTIAASGCVGLGGDHITNDISIVMKLPLQASERLKTQHGSVYFDSRSEGSTITIEPDRGFSGAQVDQNTLNQVIHMRAKEVFTLIHQELEPTGCLEHCGAGLFLTGGGSLLEGVSDLAQAVFKLPVQRGSTDSMRGLRAMFENPQYATPIGLIRYAQLVDHQETQQGAMSKIGSWLKGSR